MKTIKILLCTCCILLVLNTTAQQQVSIEEAKNAAVQFVGSKLDKRTLSTSAINREPVAEKVHSLKKENNTLMYEVVFDDGQGVLLSGSKACLPVLGFFDVPDKNKSIFDDDTPCCLKYMLEEYETEIALCFKNDTIALYHQSDWQDLQETSTTKKAAKSVTNQMTTAAVVGPLLKSKWGQREANSGECDAYNYSVKKTSSSCACISQKCTAGCVAVAMAQVMYFWKYPVYQLLQGMPFDWCNMADSLHTSRPNYTNERNAVANLIKACGDAVGMKYCNNGCGSSATTGAARDALVNNFSFHKNADKQMKTWHSSSTWTSRIKNQLDAGRPVIYGGQSAVLSPTYAHSFVCDGYKDSNYFHFNFGWNGDYSGNDDWFILGYLSPGDKDYNTLQDAIFYLRPEADQNYCNFSSPLWKHFAFGHNQQNVPQRFTVLESVPATYPAAWRTIESGQTATYTAHEKVILKPGFHAKAGSNFTARIEPCNNCGSAAHAPSITKSIDATTEDLEFLEQYLADNPIEFKTTNEIQVFPNPTTGKVYVLTNTEKVSRIEIKNLQGITILQSNDVPQTEIMLDISVQPAGIYFLTVQTENGVQTFKILKN